MSSSKVTVVIGPVRKHPRHGFGYDIVNEDGHYSFSICGSKDDPHVNREATITGLRMTPDLVHLVVATTQDDFKSYRRVHER